MRLREPARAEAVMNAHVVYMTWYRSSIMGVKPERRDQRARNSSGRMASSSTPKRSPRQADGKEKISQGGIKLSIS